MDANDPCHIFSGKTYGPWRFYFIITIIIFFRFTVLDKTLSSISPREACSSRKKTLWLTALELQNKGASGTSICMTSWRTINMAFAEWLQELYKEFCRITHSLSNITALSVIYFKCQKQSNRFSSFSATLKQHLLGSN